MTLTLRSVAQLLSVHGMSIRKQVGEYRVTFQAHLMASAERRETCAYYTDDLQDAYNTGREMREHWNGL